MAKKWTEDLIQQEASKYSTKRDWKANSPLSYNAAKKRKIIDKVASHMVRPKSLQIKWTLDTIREEALKYKTKKEWIKNSNSSHYAAFERGVLHEVSGHMHRAKTWTKDTIWEEARRFPSLNDWTQQSASSYRAAASCGILDEIKATLIVEKRSWTLDEIRKVALKHEYSSDFKKKDPSRYRYAAMNGMLPEVTKHMKSANSREEKIMLSWVQEFYPQAIPKKIGKYIYDIYIPSLNLAIEYNGLYWHNEQNLAKRLFDKPFEELTSKEKSKIYNYHIDKTNLAKENGITLIHIWEHEWLERPDQVKNFIYSKLRLGKSVGARKCEFKEIPKTQAQEFCNENHIQGAPRDAELSIGAFYEGELITVTTYAKHHRQLNQIVLNRMCSKFGVHVAGALSKMSQVAAKHFGCEIKTWCHKTLSDGQSYVKAGWEIADELRPDYFYQKGQTAFSKQSHKKDCIKKKAPEVYSPDKTERQMTVEMGLGRIWDCGKYTLIFKGKP